MKAPAPRGAETGAQTKSGTNYSLSQPTPAELANWTRIFELVPDLGGPQVKRSKTKPHLGHCRAWYRGGTNPTSLKFDDSRGLVYDFGVGQGGGVLWLIERTLGCTKSEAVSRLASFHGVTLDRESPQSARERRARWKRAQAAAEALEAFRRGITGFLRIVRNSIYDHCRELDVWATQQGQFSDDPLWIEVARAPERMRIADGINDFVLEVEGMGARELVDLRKRLELPR